MDNIKIPQGFQEMFSFPLIEALLGHRSRRFFMGAAVDALCARKFGPDGPFNPDTPGPWKDSSKIRSAAQVHDERFRECIAMQAQYVYDTFGKFPGTVPSMFLIMYLQAHHLDLDFYKKFYNPGAYLKTHAEHIKHSHSNKD